MASGIRVATDRICRHSGIMMYPEGCNRARVFWGCSQECGKCCGDTIMMLLMLRNLDIT